MEIAFDVPVSLRSVQLSDWLFELLLVARTVQSSEYASNLLKRNRSSKEHFESRKPLNL